MIPPSMNLLDPELLEALSQTPDFVLDEQTLPAIRNSILEMLGAGADCAGPQPGENIIIPGVGEQPGIRALIYQPSRPAKPGELRPGIFHVHGGGFVMGAPEIQRTRDAALAEKHGCVVLAPAYRLAPEAKYPAALDDLWTALKWFADNAPALGLDPARIIVTGDSAGGGLAAALVLYARTKKEIRIRAQALVYTFTLGATW